MAEVITTMVELGDRSYPVHVGAGARNMLASRVPGSARRVAVVTQQSVPRNYVPEFEGHDVEMFEIGDGEDAKSLTTVENLCRSFSRFGLGRGDVVVGVGGGMVTDVAGFAASVYHRGIPVMHVATTLLAMIDAAIGGKTGVNLVEGKNLVGAYWQPLAVACDTDSLATLPRSETDCGNGEMAKYHFIARTDLASLPLTERIAECVRIKAGIVASDERESGRRALLNYGHTMGHAIETVSRYTVAHGVAVATGLLFAAHLANTMEMISLDRVDEHYRVVHDVYGLVTPIPAGLDADVALEVMSRDKKALGSLTFVLDSAEGLVVVPGVSPDHVRTAYAQFVERVRTSH